MAQKLIPTDCGMLLPGNRTDDHEYDSNCCLLLTLNCLLHDKYDTLSRAMFIRFCKDNYHLLDHVPYQDKDVLKIAVDQALEESAILHQQIDSILIHIFAWYHNIRIVMRYGNRKSSDTNDDIIDSINSFGPVGQRCGDPCGGDLRLFGPLLPQRPLRPVQARSRPSRQSATRRPATGDRPSSKPTWVPSRRARRMTRPF